MCLPISELPQKRDIKIDSGIRLEISFEHLNWLSNAIVLCLRVTDLGDATFCDPSLMLDKLPMVCVYYYSIFGLRCMVAYSQSL